MRSFELLFSVYHGAMSGSGSPPDAKHLAKCGWEPIACTVTPPTGKFDVPGILVMWKRETTPAPAQPIPARSVRAREKKPKGRKR